MPKSLEEIKEKIRGHSKIIIIAGLAVLGLGIFWLVSRGSTGSEGLSPSSLSVSPTLSTKSSTPKASPSTSAASIQGGKIVVDLKGAVQKPDIYNVDASLRVADVIKLAGGFTAEADQRSVNLAAKLKDEEVIVVAKIGENAAPVGNEGGTASSGSGAAAGAKSSSGKVNINTASLTELQTLSGVGAKKAQDIIDYREGNGPFKSIDELGKVSGFGPKSLEKLKDSITVD